MSRRSRGSAGGEGPGAKGRGCRWRRERAHLEAGEVYRWRDQRSARGEGTGGEGRDLQVERAHVEVGGGTGGERREHAQWLEICMGNSRQPLFL